MATQQQDAPTLTKEAETSLPTIDADAHVIETERTWEYMDASDERYRPVLVAPVRGGGERPRWLVDGQVRGFGSPSREPGRMEEREKTSGRTILTPEESAQMADVDARLRHMDEVGVDIPRGAFPTPAPPASAPTHLTRAPAPRLGAQSRAPP